jgi:hypothetical protein
VAWGHTRRVSGRDPAFASLEKPRPHPLTPSPPWMRIHVRGPFGGEGEDTQGGRGRRSRPLPPWRTSLSQAEAPSGSKGRRTGGCRPARRPVCPSGSRRPVPPPASLENLSFPRRSTLRLPRAQDWRAPPASSSRLPFGGAGVRCRPMPPWRILPPPANLTRIAKGSRQAGWGRRYRVSSRDPVSLRRGAAG